MFISVVNAIIGLYMAYTTMNQNTIAFIFWTVWSVLNLMVIFIN